MRRRIVLSAIGLLPILCSSASPFLIDGRFDDWAEVAPAAIDPTGDATGAFDLTRVSAVCVGPALYVRFTITTVLNLHSGPESEGTLRLEISLPDGSALRIDCRKREAILPDPSLQPVGLSEIPFISSPTHAADEFELRVDLSGYGLRQGDRIAIEFSGSDRLDEPLWAAWIGDAPPPVRRSADRGEDTAFRVASLNTLANGLGTEMRSAALGRLLRAVQADIYCFQEEEDTPDLPARLERLMPGGAPWQVHRSGDCVIATRHELEPADINAPWFAAAIVRMPEKPPVLMASVHLSCCGYIGNPNDLQRIDQAQALLDALQRLRPHPESPIVAAGDYNLVGSRTPLDLLETIGLRHQVLPGLIGDSVATWRDIALPFAPGLLDLLLYANLSPTNGFVMDSSTLSTEECAALGIHPDDSEVSDHLLLVADFRFPE